jgi:Kdo2-lipid IVA lauroyltransferase/acyltransferase
LAASQKLPTFAGMWFMKLFSRMPFWALYGLSDGLSWIFFALLGYRRKVVLENLRHAFPGQSDAWYRKTSRAFYRSFTDIWLEALKTLTLSPKNMRKHVTFLNPEILQQWEAKGKSTMMLAGHTASWEWLFVRGSLDIKNVVAVYLKVENPFFDKLMLQIRSRYGARLIEKAGLLREILRSRGQYRNIAMVADQAPRKGSLYEWHSFMNRPAPFFDSAEKMARKEEMPLYYIGIKRIKRGYYQMWAEELGRPPYGQLPEGELTARYIRALESNIRQQPEGYLWSHKRWKHQPPASVLAPAAATAQTDSTMPGGEIRPDVG